jgi:hypothetical protein
MPNAETACPSIRHPASFSRAPFFITLLKDVQHASPAGSVRDGVCCERGRLPSKNAARRLGSGARPAGGL